MNQAQTIENIKEGQSHNESSQESAKNKKFEAYKNLFPDGKN